MKILAVDVGTGTQDILLFDSRLDVENALQLVLPSATMILRRRIQRATRRRSAIVLYGQIMGGGPCAWAVEDHLKAGLTVYATPPAAQTLNDDLQAVEEMGVNLITESEVYRLPEGVERIEMMDFDFGLLRRTLLSYEVSLDDLAAVAVAVFDHGAAPRGVSDRQFRFDYLDRRIRAENRLSAFAFPAQAIPPEMTRLQAVAAQAQIAGVPVVVMDTAPAAVRGALFDPQVCRWEHALVVNVGNFHTLAFRFGEGRRIEGVFEHHTGFLTPEKLDAYLSALAQGTLTHAEVFTDNGHGALVYHPNSTGEMPPVTVTGPRRNLMSASALRPHFATPFGDMMMSGCYGLLAAVADHLPHLREEILERLNAAPSSAAPWDAP